MENIHESGYYLDQRSKMLSINAGRTCLECWREVSSALSLLRATSKQTMVEESSHKAKLCLSTTSWRNWVSPGQKGLSRSRAGHWRLPSTSDRENKAFFEPPFCCMITTIFEPLALHQY